MNAKLITAKTSVKKLRIPIILCSKGLMLGMTLQIESNSAFTMHPIKKEYFKNLRNRLLFFTKTL